MSEIKYNIDAVTNTRTDVNKYMITIDGWAFTEGSEQLVIELTGINHDDYTVERWQRKDVCDAHCLAPLLCGFRVIWKVRNHSREAKLSFRVNDSLQAETVETDLFMIPKAPLSIYLFKNTLIGSGFCRDFYELSKKGFSLLKDEGWSALLLKFKAWRKQQGGTKSRAIIYVCHDAHFHGAQILSLNIIRILSLVFKYEVHMLLLSGGELEKEFIKYAYVYNLAKHYNTTSKINKLIDDLKKKEITSAISNTVITGDIVKHLSLKDIRVISLIHELPGIIKSNNAEEKAKKIAEYADYVLFASNYICDRFETITTLDKNKIVIQPQGLYKVNRLKSAIAEAGVDLRKRLNICDTTKIVLGVGYADYRKGIDMFIKVAYNVAQENKGCCFVWLGNRDSALLGKLKREINHLENRKALIFVDATHDTDLFYAGADIYLLTSREDPFPTVVLEAMDVGLPVIGFCDAGGFVDIVNDDTGALVPFENVQAMSDKIIEILNNDELILKMSANSSSLIEEKFNFISYNYKLLSFLEHNYKKVSVIVPNYNYAGLLLGRVKNIIDQTYPVYEIITLDDCSTDDSVEVINRLKDKYNYHNIIVNYNEVNSGNVSRQWQKGVELAKGDYIWIAEADDLCEITFLENVIRGFSNEGVVLSYCQSKQLDKHGNIIAEDYLDYTNDIDQEKWKKSYFRNGLDEIKDTLSIKNTIPNVSSVVFKRSAAAEVLKNISGYEVAGDWWFYVHILERGDIFFCEECLNLHRRHDRSITSRLNAQQHFSEIVKMQDYVYEKFDVGEKNRRIALQHREKVCKYLGL